MQVLPSPSVRHSLSQSNRCLHSWHTRKTPCFPDWSLDRYLSLSGLSKSWSSPVDHSWITGPLLITSPWQSSLYSGQQASIHSNWRLISHWNLPLLGLPVSVLFGYFVLKKRYTLMQLVNFFLHISMKTFTNLFIYQISIATVTAGVVVVTLSKTSPGAKIQTPSHNDLGAYAIGITMLTISLFCSGLLGILQERTYAKYGPCWKEGVFYTVSLIIWLFYLIHFLTHWNQHVLSLPIFIFLGRDIKQGMTSLYDPSSTTSAIQSFTILASNLITQLFCVSGVNRLTSVSHSPLNKLSQSSSNFLFGESSHQQVSSVSTNIALTVRKALSLCFSVWWFGNDWNAQLGIGAFMVFFGSLMYTLNVDKIHKKD